MRARQQKKSQEPVRTGKPAPARLTFPMLTPHRELAGESDYPFYTLNQETARLHVLAIYIRDLDELKQLWEANLGDEEDNEFVFLEPPGRFTFLAQSMMLRVLAQNMVNGDAEAIRGFAQACAAYEDGCGDLANKDMAKLCLMSACHALWIEGHERSSVTKAQLKDRAAEIWARFRCRRKRMPPSTQNLKNEIARLPVVDWPLIFKELALSDVQEAKRGRRPKIGNSTP
jgi:hypothetical protein